MWTSWSCKYGPNFLQLQQSFEFLGNSKKLFRFNIGACDPAGVSAKLWAIMSSGSSSSVCQLQQVWELLWASTSVGKMGIFVTDNQVHWEEDKNDIKARWSQSNWIRKCVEEVVRPNVGLKRNLDLQICCSPTCSPTWTPINDSHPLLVLNCIYQNIFQRLG